jgi:hypothetical protein
MKLAIMQPYFFPYLGYFSLIRYADRFILFDPVQFIRHGWIERNRILKPAEGWQYIKVSIEKHSRETFIKEIKINNSIDWRNQIFRQLEHYKKKAPYYKQVVELMKDCFSGNEDSIVKLNHRCLKLVCKYLDIELRADIFSEMDLKIGEVSHPGEWALRISETVNATEYVNPPGGQEIFDKKQFDDAGIGLKFLRSRLPVYNQFRPDFENGLSIIDVMMFNSDNEIRQMIDDYEFI